MKSKLRPAILIVVLVALIGLVLVGCNVASPSGWSGPVVNKGMLYLGTQEGKLIALNAQTGNPDLPSVDVESEDGGASFGCASGSSNAALYSTVVMSSDMIYIGDYEGVVHAYTFKLGAGWGGKEYKIDGHIIGNLVLYDGYLYFGASDKKVYALNASNGQLKEGWPFKTKGKIWSAPPVADGVVYIGTLDHHVYAIDADTGQAIPGFNFKADGAIMTAPLVQGDTIYVGANDRYLYALNKTDGTLKWKFKGNGWFWAQPVISDDMIYAVSINGKVYALKDMGDTYGLIWQHELEADVTAPLLLVKIDDEELIFVGDHDKCVTALYTAETPPEGAPRVKSTIKFDGSIYAPLGYSEENSFVYVYTKKHELHALNAATYEHKWTFDTDEMRPIFK